MCSGVGHDSCNFRQIQCIADNPKSVNAVISSDVGACLLELMIEDDTELNFQLRNEVLKSTNALLENCALSIRDLLLEDKHFEQKLYCFAKQLELVGDYEFQVGLIECLFRLIPKKQRHLYGSTFFSNPAVSNEFCEIRDQYFETDTRLFLNNYNASFEEGKRVKSVPCIAVFLGDKELKKPDDPGYEEFWVDFNYGSERITIFCEHYSVISSQTSFTEDSWETLTIHKDNVKLFYVSTVEHTDHVVIQLFEPIHTVFPSQSDVSGNDIHIHFRSVKDVEDVISKTFGFEKKHTKKNRRKVSTVKELLFVSSNKRKKLEYDYESEDPQHICSSQEEPISRVKVSIPCEPIKVYDSSQSQRSEAFSPFNADPIQGIANKYMNHQQRKDLDTLAKQRTHEVQQHLGCVLSTPSVSKVSEPVSSIRLESDRSSHCHSKSKPSTRTPEKCSTPKTAEAGSINKKAKVKIKTPVVKITPAHETIEKKPHHAKKRKPVCQNVSRKLTSVDQDVNYERKEEKSTSDDISIPDSCPLASSDHNAHQKENKEHGEDERRMSAKSSNSNAACKQNSVADAVIKNSKIIRKNKSMDHHSKSIAKESVVEDTGNKKENHGCLNEEILKNDCIKSSSDAVSNCKENGLYTDTHQNCDTFTERNELSSENIVKCNQNIGSSKRKSNISSKGKFKSKGREHADLKSQRLKNKLTLNKQKALETKALETENDSQKAIECMEMDPSLSLKNCEEKSEIENSSNLSISQDLVNNEEIIATLKEKGQHSSRQTSMEKLHQSLSTTSIIDADQTCVPNLDASNSAEKKLNSTRRTKGNKSKKCKKTCEKSCNKYDDDNTKQGKECSLGENDEDIELNQFDQISVQSLKTNCKQESKLCKRNSQKFKVMNTRTRNSTVPISKSMTRDNESPQNKTPIHENIPLTDASRCTNSTSVEREQSIEMKGKCIGKTKRGRKPKKPIGSNVNRGECDIDNFQAQNDKDSSHCISACDEILEINGKSVVKADDVNDITNHLNTRTQEKSVPKVKSASKPQSEDADEVHSDLPNETGNRKSFFVGKQSTLLKSPGKHKGSDCNAYDVGRYPKRTNKSGKKRSVESENVSKNSCQMSDNGDNDNQMQLEKISTGKGALQNLHHGYGQCFHHEVQSDEDISEVLLHKETGDAQDQGNRSERFMHGIKGAKTIIESREFKDDSVQLVCGKIDSRDTPVREEVCDQEKALYPRKFSIFKTPLSERHPHLSQNGNEPLLKHHSTLSSAARHLQDGEPNVHHRKPSSEMQYCSRQGLKTVEVYVSYSTMKKLKLPSEKGDAITDPYDFENECEMSATTSEQYCKRAPLKNRKSTSYSTSRKKKEVIKPVEFGEYLNDFAGDNLNETLIQYSGSQHTESIKTNNTNKYAEGKLFNSSMNFKIQSGEALLKENNDRIIKEKKGNEINEDRDVPAKVTKNGEKSRLQAKTRKDKAMNCSGEKVNQNEMKLGVNLSHRKVDVGETTTCILNSSCEESVEEDMVPSEENDVLSHFNQMCQHIMNGNEDSPEFRSEKSWNASPKQKTPYHRQGILSQQMNEIQRKPAGQIIRPQITESGQKTPDCSATSGTSGIVEISSIKISSLVPCCSNDIQDDNKENLSSSDEPSPSQNHQGTKLHEDELSEDSCHSLEHIASGLVSGFSTEIRPSRSAVKRKYTISTHDEEELLDYDEDEYPTCHLKPRKLFNTEYKAAVRETKNGPFNQTSNTDYEALCKSSMQSNTDQFGIAHVLKAIGMDFQNQMQMRRISVEKLTKESLRSSYRQISKSYEELQTYREKILKEYLEKLIGELAALGKDVQKLETTEAATLSFFKQQLKVLQDCRLHQEQRLKGLQAMQLNFMKSMKKAEVYASIKRKSLTDIMKKGLTSLQKQVLLEAQQQELNHVKRNLQSMIT